MKFKRIFTSIIAFVMLLTCFTGCKKDAVSDPKRETYKGTHIYTATETADYLVENGRSDYVVVTPKNSSSLIQQAKREFVYLFEKATNVSLRTIEEDEVGLQHSATAKYISIGRTKMLESSGLKADYIELGKDGGKIMTKDKTIYIIGGLDNGTLYAVYTFMQLEFNFEQYFLDCYEIDENVSKVKLKKYNVTDIPDIPIRENGSGLLNIKYAEYDKQNAAKRMKMGNGLWSTQFPIHQDFDPSSPSKKVHNSMYYLPKSVYGVSHPEWYSNSGNQLCYTAHGDTESLQDMVQACADKIIFSLKVYNPIEYPQYNVVTLTMEDNNNSCNCSGKTEDPNDVDKEGCVEVAQKYGTESAAVVLFANKVAEVVDEWMEQPENVEYKREDLHILFFAYHNFVNPPSKYDSKTGKYLPVDQDVVFHDRVGVYLAPINAFFDTELKDPQNKEALKSLEGWNAVSNYTFYWLYATNFYYYNYLYDSMNFFTGDLYAYIANRDAKYLFTQQQHDQVGTSTAWHNLKIYLDAKLAWDCSLDETMLVDKWFNAMFREAAPIMKNLYYKERSWAQYSYKKKNLNPGGVYGKIENKELWPFVVLKDWVLQCESAMAVVEHYKTTSPEIYEQMYNHIYSEWIFPAYAILHLWDIGLMTGQERTAMIEKFKEVLEKIDPTGAMYYDDYDGKYIDFINKL